MFKKFLERFKKFKNVLKETGYTLIEVAAVVAITATLAAVIVPIAVDKVQDGKLAAAKLDVQTIAAGITAFNKDTGVWPAIGAASPTHSFAVLRSGTSTATGGDTIETGTGLVTGASGFDPAIGGATGWTTDATGFGHLDTQLVIEPAGLTSSYNWKGPYVESYKKKDPWGNNYLVYVKAMYAPETTKRYGWIISAGPDGVLQTNPTDSVIKGNDIGLMLFSATDTRAGGTATAP